MQTKALHHTVQIRKGQFLLAAALALLALALLPRPAAATINCPTPFTDIVAPSCFEGGDGNLLVDSANLVEPRIDWTSVVGLPKFQQYHDPDQPSDDVFDSSAADENTPGSWSILPGQKAPSKADILNTASFTEQAGSPGQIFLYAAFEETAGGNVDVSFELNKGQVDPATGEVTSLTYDNGVSSIPVPFRSENDVLITFDGGVNSVDIGLCYWDGDEHSGHWTSGKNGTGFTLGGPNHTCPTLLHTQAEGNVNSGDLTNNTLTDFSNPIPSGDFGEMAINLSTTLGANSTCFQLGGIWMHSRSSPQASSTMQDFVVPHSINGLNNCAQTVDKKIATGASNVDPTGLSYVDGPLSVNDGAWLYYTLTAKNTGTQPITHTVGGNTLAGPDMSDPNCSSISSGAGAPASGAGTPSISDDVPANADKLHDSSGTLIADPTPATYDSGDVWIFRCKHQYNFGTDGSPFVNTVTTNGDVGTFSVTEHTDHADATRIPPGKVRAGKTVVGGTGNETWNFTVAGVTKTAIGNGQTTSSEDVVPGTPTTISEGSMAAGTGTFVLTSIVCTKVGGGTVTYPPDLANKSVSVTPATGEDITCQFTNTKQATVKASKTTIGGTGTWPFTVAGHS